MTAQKSDCYRHKRKEYPNVGNILKFVEDGFSIDYAVNAWRAFI